VIFIGVGGATICRALSLAISSSVRWRQGAAA
jgi:hypothetical protein